MAGSKKSMALAKRASDSSLMPPPPPTKRIKRPAKVLDEEEYVDALSHIVARDFFPGLLESKAQSHYLDALDSKDPEWIAAAGRDLTAAMTPNANSRRRRGRRGTNFDFQTPLHATADTPRGWAGDTPGSVVSTASSVQTSVDEKAKIDTNMSLGAFQQKYTSEDNESFYKLLDKQNEKRAEKYAWLWAGNKIPAARQIAHRKRQQLIEERKEDARADQEKQVIRLDPEDERPAMPDTWASVPNNGLMFTPQSVEDSMETVAQVREQKSSAPPKAIIYNNTRVPDPAASAAPVPPSPALSAVKDAIAGRPRLNPSDASYAGDATPTVNGYSFVDSEEPEPTPEDLAYDPKDLLPKGDDARANPFKLLEGSKRETLHYRMVEKVAKSKRPAVSKPRPAEMRSPATPKFVSSPRIEKKGGLTPAAERLFGRVAKGGHGNAQDVWEGQGRTPRRSGLREMLTPGSQK